MFARNRIPLIAFLALFAVAGCSSDSADEETLPDRARDPLVARALADPLMSDPDLAYRNEANAAIALQNDHILPPLAASDEAAERARNAARMELLKGGPIAELPSRFAAGDGPESFAAIATADAILRKAGGSAACAERLVEGLIHAADLPAAAAIMPHGMAQQAAGTTGGGCEARVVRYLTPVGASDVIEWHYTLAERARLRPVLYGEAEVALAAEGRLESLAVQARPGPNGLTAVDLVYWRK